MALFWNYLSFRYEGAVQWCALARRAASMQAVQSLSKHVDKAGDTHRKNHPKVTFAHKKYYSIDASIKDIKVLKGCFQHTKKLIWPGVHFQHAPV